LRDPKVRNLLSEMQEEKLAPTPNAIDSMSESQLRQLLRAEGWTDPTLATADPHELRVSTLRIDRGWAN
jgi:hypothetical protein